LPENPKALERVMGMFAYYSKWLPRFSDPALPLRSRAYARGVGVNPPPLEL